MAILYERTAVAKPTDWADLISVIESESTPFTSMVSKRTKPAQVTHYWQAKQYPTVGHLGVLDGLDATEFNSNQAEELVGVAQKLWYNVGVSDFMEDAAHQAGVSGSAIRSQTSEGLITLKRMIEKRCLSDAEAVRDDGIAQGNETRGVFKWTDNAFNIHAVPTNFQTPLDSKYAGTLIAFTEDEMGDLGESAYKQKKGQVNLDGFCGIELKRRFTEFTTYQAQSAGGATYTPVRSFNGQQKDRELVSTIDALVLDSGRYRLHVSSFLKSNKTTGADSATTHKSGIFMDMSMCGLAYTRLPRVVNQEYQGGGHKRIIDTLFMLMVDNPLSLIAVNAT
tara:strand:+ start:1060 stop:2070 length:1011 start_codon:yes stop_codon:yes gene_type:complete